MKSSNIIRETAGVFTSNLAAMLFGFATGIILSRVLGPELKGVYTSILVIPGIIASIVMFGTRQSVIYHVGKKILSNPEAIAAVFYLFITSSCIGVLIFLAVHWIFLSEHYPIAIILPALAYIPMKMGITYSGSIFLANMQFRKANILKWLTALLNLMLVFIFVFVLRFSVSGALIALILASLGVCIIALVMIAKDHGLHFRLNKTIIRRLLSMGLVYALALFIIQLNYRVDILILKHLSTDAEIGYYSVGVSVAEKLWQLPFAISIVLLSRSANATDIRQLASEAGRMLRLGFLLILIASALLFLLVPIMLPLIYGEAYRPSVGVVQSILPGIVFFVIVRILSASLAGLGKPRHIIFIFLPALILNIILNFIWIPKYGAIGAAWATNVSYISGAAVLMGVYARVTGTSLRSLLAFERGDFRVLQNFRKIKKEKKQLKLEQAEEEGGGE